MSAASTPTCCCTVTLDAPRTACPVHGLPAAVRCPWCILCPRCDPLMEPSAGPPGAAYLNCGSSTDCTLAAPDGEPCRKHAIAGMVSALDKAETWQRAQLAAHGPALDRYAAALDAIAALGQHVHGCREVSVRCDCGVCPDRHGGNPQVARACPAPRHYAHGPGCASARAIAKCASGCPTATAKRALEEP